MRNNDTHNRHLWSWGAGLFLLLPFCLFIFSACGEKQYRYVSDAPRDMAMPITNTYTSTIMPGDILHIHVDGPSPEAVLQFNEETNRNAISDLGTTRNTKLHGYTVSTNGDIIMAVIGRIHAAGLTMDELADTIAARIVEGGYINNPHVTVSLSNFHVTMIGEVKRPMVISSPSERLTIFEALAMCGDVTMYGIRTCVVIVRTIDSVQTIVTVDLTSKEILNSPYYYLRQNDIVYVEPNAKRKRQAYRDDDWIRYTTTGLASIRLAYVVIRYYQRIEQLNNN